MSRDTTTLLLTALALLQPAVAACQDGDPAATITASDLRERIGVLADDSMRGRDTPSPELEQAARYVATKFSTFGLRPGAGDVYLQHYPLTIVAAGPDDGQSVALIGPDGRVDLDSATDFVSIPVAAQATGAGELVAISLEDEETDLEGRVALLSISAQQIQRAFTRMRDLVRQRGATGVILAVSSPPAYLDGLRSFFSQERISLGAPDTFEGPIVLVATETLPEPLAEAARRGPAETGWSAEMRSTAGLREAQGVNSIGWLEGSDPELKDEFVVFTAHMDHVGVGGPVDGDSIYNGADDDASGTATIIELAQAFAQTDPHPRRSLIFMTVSGEEKGLFGSRWYAENPEFPLENTVANINLDMIGRNWEDTVVAIGKKHSSLGPTVERVAAEHPELGLSVIDDVWPEENFYFRSDHFNFARNGVPILFFFSGVHEDYHRPSDEPEAIQYEKTARIGQLIYYLGLDVANADGRPEWDPAAFREIVEGG